MIDLFEHNQKAYDSAVSLLSETGKAAVIHPTGTGKSLIAFKLCTDNPDKIICWLSPSEYIFKTQLENLAKVSDGWQPENIRFYTYARLMNLTEDELADIRPDYIVLDEFHRCGAKEWGKGVAALLGLYGTVPVLGLSATNIRYLDNQRDMADELFDGNIASEMTLGEAIVRGILAAPKYVLSVFSYKQQLETYKRRVRQTKNKAVRDTAEQYLDALRHALEKAEGLDTVFAKHMTERTGKYIVFCTDSEHMRQMSAKAGEWFAKVDKEPHIYTVYSEDPLADKSFRAFKADTDTEHLKLLYCIDALNEGVHVDDVSGVILLRPTISPILYKQQIGRALAAGKKENPVIFDIVLNIENLYSIGAIEEEMQLAMTYYRSHGLADDIVNEYFQVIDEVRDCKELFDKLDDVLTASWDMMYDMACRYRAEHGNLEIPYKYKTPEGYSLGNWILTQKRVRAGEQFGILTEERIAKLDALGMTWGSYRDHAWERNFAAAKDYYETYGNLAVTASYVTESGLHLGNWIAGLRSARKNAAWRRYLTPERIKLLDEIGMIWDVPDHLWQQYYAACTVYYKEHGNLDIPLPYVTADGIRLGKWIHNIRSVRKTANRSYTLSSEQIKALDELDMLWDRKNDRLWEKGYRKAMQYRKEFGNLEVPSAYQTSDGYRLGAWISEQRQKPNLSEHRKQRLDALGMRWKKPDSWEIRYTLAKDFYKTHGHLNMPASYKADGIWLAKWLNEQRQIYIGNRAGKCLTAEQIKALEEIGMSWENRTEQKSRKAWETGYSHAAEYAYKNKNLDVPGEYVCADGYRLGNWISNQRNRHNNPDKYPALTEAQTEQLEKIGMIWHKKQEQKAPAVPKIHRLDGRYGSAVI